MPEVPPTRELPPVLPAHPTISAEDLKRCTEILEAVAEDSLILSTVPADERIKLLVAAGRVIKPDGIEVRRRIKALRRAKREARHENDRQVRAQTEIRTARLESVFVPPPRNVAALGHDAGPETPSRGELKVPRYCYICKEEFTRLHHFYDAMCPKCAPFNYEKRFQTADLRGRVALITGARLKIGYQAAIMMLRAGARVIVTTRFPQDAALRFAREPEFATFKDRLHVHGLDLRHSPSVETFCRYVERTHERLDILINNAAQTVRRPPGFYAHLMAVESLQHHELPPEARPLLASHEECKRALAQVSPARGEIADGTQWVAEWHANKPGAPALGLAASAQLSQIPYACDGAEELAPDLFPEGKLDADLQQVDLRKLNSWRMTLAQVPTAEMLEVQLINSVAPFILCSKLKPLMERSPRLDERTPGMDKHIVNVSAMEGKFARHTKTDKHPHTNMAKAALNMMTLTSARDYVKSGIHMNAVDTGWVTDEDPAELSARKREEQDFQPPLDIVDGAARVMDPVFAGLNSGKHSWGCFLKDYVPTAW